MTQWTSGSVCRWYCPLRSIIPWHLMCTAVVCSSDGEDQHRSVRNHNSFLDKIRIWRDILWRLEMHKVLCFLIRSVEVIPVLMYCRRPWLPHSRWCFKHADWERLGGRCLRDYSNRFKVSQRWWSQGVACGDNSGPTHQPFITHHTLGRFLAAHPSGWAEPPTTQCAFSSVAHGLILLRTAELVLP